MIYMINNYNTMIGLIKFMLFEKLLGGHVCVYATTPSDEFLYTIVNPTTAAGRAAQRSGVEA